MITLGSSGNGGPSKDVIKRPNPRDPSIVDRSVAFAILSDASLTRAAEAVRANNSASENNPACPARGFNCVEWLGHGKSKDVSGIEREEGIMSRTSNQPAFPRVFAIRCPPWLRTKKRRVSHALLAEQMNRIMRHAALSPHVPHQRTPHVTLYLYH